jgi:hypothetical protein
MIWISSEQGVSESCLRSVGVHLERFITLQGTLALKYFVTSLGLSRVAFGSRFEDLIHK